MLNIRKLVGQDGMLAGVMERVLSSWRGWEDWGRLLMAGERQIPHLCLIRAIKVIREVQPAQPGLSLWKDCRTNLFDGEEGGWQAPDGALPLIPAVWPVFSLNPTLNYLFCVIFPSIPCASPWHIVTSHPPRCCMRACWASDSKQMQSLNSSKKENVFK